MTSGSVSVSPDKLRLVVTPLASESALSTFEELDLIKQNADNVETFYFAYYPHYLMSVMESMPRPSLVSPCKLVSILASPDILILWPGR